MVMETREDALVHRISLTTQADAATQFESFSLKNSAGAKLAPTCQVLTIHINNSPTALVSTVVEVVSSAVRQDCRGPGGQP